MNLKLEELRKRLLDPGTQASPPPRVETIYKRSAETSGTAEPPVTNGSDTAERRNVSAHETQSDPEPEPIENTAFQDIRADSDLTAPKARYQLAQAVGKVFESTKLHQERLAELAKSFDVIERTADAAARAFEPIIEFRDQMAKLSKTFEPMRSFQEQLGTMAESFEPMKALHEQMVQLAQAFETNLTQFARSLEPVKAFQTHLARLATTFESVSELQDQFLELSETFHVSSQSDGDGNGAGTSDQD
jgi:hypothetical protein